MSQNLHPGSGNHISFPHSRNAKDSGAEGAARDPERKGPSLGPNAGGVSLDRQRLGTTAGKGDKMTYQSRFGVRADTPGRTGNSELFKKRPYRLLYLPRRKASCRETKDVPYLKIQGHTAEGLYRRRASRALGAQRCLYTRQKPGGLTGVRWGGATSGSLCTPGL